MSFHSQITNIPGLKYSIKLNYSIAHNATHDRPVAGGGAGRRGRGGGGGLEPPQNFWKLKSNVP